MFLFQAASKAKEKPDFLMSEAAALGGPKFLSRCSTYYAPVLQDISKRLVSDLKKFGLTNAEKQLLWVPTNQIFEFADKKWNVEIENHVNKNIVELLRAMIHVEQVHSKGQEGFMKSK